jgi:hypothetical protein
MDLCTEFQTQFRDYLDGRLAASRRLLIEDHLARCPQCRGRLAAEKGERNEIPMPPRSAAWWPKWGTWAVAAALLFLALYLGRDYIDDLLAPGGPRATVVSLQGSLYLVPGEMLKAGSAIGEKAVVRTGPRARAVLRLRDGSLVDVNERTELSVHRARGPSIRLQRGDIIVRAAKQLLGHHLRVETRNSVAAASSAIFAVSTGFGGTLVSVVEGSAAVAQPGTEAVLYPGEQAASNPALTGSIPDAVSWSPEAGTYIAALGQNGHVREQQKPGVIEQDEMALAFKRTRAGPASILADTGSGGAAEYLSTDSIAAVYASTLEPQQIFEELATLFSQFSPVLQNNLATVKAQIGADLSNDLSRAFGAESAFAIEGITATGPVWTIAVLVNDSAAIDITMRRLADAVNAGFEKTGKPERMKIDQESFDGRPWTTLHIPPLAITWAYDRGYVVAGSDRGAATKAIATRNGGTPLVWSPLFQQQLSSSTGLHPSGFIWVNTKGTLGGLAALVPNPAIQGLLAQNVPILVTFGGTMEQIRVVSRTGLSGMILNLMLQGMDRARAGSQTSNAQAGTN